MFRKIEISEKDLKVLLARMAMLEKEVAKLKESPVRKKFLSVREACEYLDVTREYIYQLKSLGRLTTSHPGPRKLYILRESLDALLEQDVRHGNPGRL